MKNTDFLQQLQEIKIPTVKPTESLQNLLDEIIIPTVKPTRPVQEVLNEIKIPTKEPISKKDLLNQHLKNQIKNNTKLGRIDIASSYKEVYNKFELIDLMEQSLKKMHQKEGNSDKYLLCKFKLIKNKKECISQYNILELNIPSHKLK